MGGLCNKYRCGLDTTVRQINYDATTSRIVFLYTGPNRLKNGLNFHISIVKTIHAVAQMPIYAATIL